MNNSLTFNNEFIRCDCAGKCIGHALHYQAGVTAVTGTITFKPAAEHPAITPVGDDADTLPWLMFYRDGKTIGEIAEVMGLDAYDSRVQAPLRAYSRLMRREEASTSIIPEAATELKETAFIDALNLASKCPVAWRRSLYEKIGIMMKVRGEVFDATTAPATQQPAATCYANMIYRRRPDDGNRIRCRLFQWQGPTPADELRDIIEQDGMEGKRVKVTIEVLEGGEGK